MKPARRRLLLTALTTATLVAGVGGSADAATHEDPDRATGSVTSTAQPQPSESPAATEGTDATASGCVFVTNGDNVHISSTSTTYAAQGHGWWINVNCPSGTKADVTVQLQIKRNGSWSNVGSPGKKRVKPGGGSSNRSTGHVDCRNRTNSTWRSVIDVDLVGRVDSPEKAVTREVSVACTA